MFEIILFQVFFAQCKYFYHGKIFITQVEIFLPGTFRCFGILFAVFDVMAYFLMFLQDSLNTCFSVYLVLMDNYQLLINLENRGYCNVSVCLCVCICVFAAGADAGFGRGGGGLNYLGGATVTPQTSRGKVRRGGGQSHPKCKAPLPRPPPWIRAWQPYYSAASLNVGWLLHNLIWR